MIERKGIPITIDQGRIVPLSTIEERNRQSRERVAREAGAGPTRPPLTSAEARIMELARDYRVNHSGTLASQAWVATELGITGGAVYLNVQRIIDKGYFVPVRTRLSTKPNQQEKQRLLRLEGKRRKERTKRERVRALRLKGLSFKEAYKMVGGNKTDFKKIWQNVSIELVDKKEVKPRKRRTPKQMVAIKEEIKKLSRLRLSNRKIAEQTGTSYRYITNLKAQMYGLGELEKKGKIGRPRSK